MTEIVRVEPRKILSKGVAHGGTVYLSGLTAEDRSGDIRSQTEQILSAVDGFLAAFGTNKSRLLGATIWLSDIRNRASMNEVWTAWVDPQNLPARACVEARLADPDCLVEIQVTAAQ